jgi:benzoate-CoA ligase
MSDAYNATVDLLERNGPNGHLPYLLVDERAISYAEVISGADRFGAGLVEHRLRRGDRVLLCLQDAPELVMAFWGAMKAGLVPVTVAPVLSARELRYILGDSDARAIVVDASTERVISTAAAEGTVVVVVGVPAVSGFRPFSEIGSTGASLSAAETSADDPAFWLYTSGTTGQPRAVVHTHGNLRAGPAGLARQVVGLGLEDTVLSASKMFFAYGLGASVYLPAAAGARVVVSRGPSTPGMIQGAIERHRPTVLFGVPGFFRGYARLAQADLGASVRVVLSAGEVLTSELFEQFRGRFGRPLLDGLGCTEAMHHVTCNRLDDARPGSAGRPLDGYEVEVRGEDGRALPEGQSGELWLRGPTLMAGYWNRPEQTAERLVGGWLRTGDRGQLRDGRVYHEGRLDDLMKVGGIWVAPQEVESILRTHPEVRDAAVSLAHDDDGAPLLKAFLVTDRTDPALHKELMQLCGAQLARFKVPRLYEVVAELPRTATGKVRRFMLRDDKQPL